MSRWQSCYSRYPDQNFDRFGNPRLEATLLNCGYWAVRPTGQLGTWYPTPWEVCYVQAPSAAEAIQRAHHAMKELRS